MPEALLKIDNLRGGYHKEAVIKNISLTINQGDFMGIIGPNSCGKTTFLRLISKVLTPQSGSIYLDGKDVGNMRLKDFCRKVAFVPQDIAVNFPFSAWEIVSMGRIPHLKRLQSYAKADYDIIERSLMMTDALHLKDKFIDELSSGERQRLVIAKALAQEPILLFLDEPTSHLDIGHQIQILDLLKKLNRKNNLTILMVIHDLNLASEYCNRIALFNGGCIFKEGSPHEVLTYQNIEAVYRTLVVVNDNPLSDRPYVLLVSGRS